MVLPELGRGPGEGSHPWHRHAALQRTRVIRAQVVDRDEEHVGPPGRRRAPDGPGPGASERQEEQEACGEGTRASGEWAAHGAHIVAEEARPGQGTPGATGGVPPSFRAPPASSRYGPRP